MRHSGTLKERSRHGCRTNHAICEAASSASCGPARLSVFPLPRRAVERPCLLEHLQIQWANFSSWLIAGGLLGGGFALLWALVDLIRFRRAGSPRALIYFVLLLVMFVLGFVNALVHAKDAWATMPESLYLSAVTTLLALAAAWIGYSGFRSVEVA